jgi:hypothetical protein
MICKAVVAIMSMMIMIVWISPNGTRFTTILRKAYIWLGYILGLSWTHRW